MQNGASAYGTLADHGPLKGDYPLPYPRGPHHRFTHKKTGCFRTRFWNHLFGLQIIVIRIEVGIVRCETLLVTALLNQIQD